MQSAIVVGEPVPILYVKMDGTGVPVLKKETLHRKGKQDGQPAHTREVKLGCVFTQTHWDQEGYAIRDPDTTTYVGRLRPRRTLESDCTWRPGNAARVARRRRWCWATEPSGSGTWPSNISPGRFRLSICFTLRYTSGTWLASCIPRRAQNRVVRAGTCKNGGVRSQFLLRRA